jgi:uncharacterized membrane protein
MSSGPLRWLRVRPRLVMSLVLGVATGALLPLPSDLRTRFLCGWDVGALAYVVFAFAMMARATPEVLRSRAIDEDEGAGVMLVLSVLAALVSLGAIVSAVVGGGPISALGLALMATTVFLSWALLHTVFALHYAHEFELGCAARPDADPASAGGLAFPGSELPDYGDFVYFAFVIGVAAQTADVGLTKKTMRRLVVAHGVVAFWFNAVILALALNLLGRAG